MVTVPALVDEGALDQYTATAGQTAFNFTYMIFATADIKVYVNGVLKTETTDYVVKQSDSSPIVPADDLPMDGGKVVFNSGLTLNDEVSLSRDIAIERVTGYSTAGSFRADVVNAEFTKILAIQQQLERDISRSVRLSDYDAEGGTFTLPENRASKFLAFDASGNMIASAGTTEVAVSSFMETLLDDTTAAAARATLGLVIGTNVQAWGATLDALASLSFPTLSSGDEGKALRVNGTFDGYDAVAFPAGYNYIINGDFRIAQRGSSFTSATTPANNDDTYLLDRTNLVSDGNDIVDVSQELSVIPTGAFAAIKMDQETANKQWGIVQILEAQDAAALIGGVASLSFEARKGGSNATVEKLRAAIISWSSTADSVTSDVVGTWAGAGTNPTLATNWTYENTPSDLTLTDSFQKFKIENVAIDTASTKNVAVFIWLDDTDGTIGDLVYISKIKLEYGAIATPYIASAIDEELALCKRYFQPLMYNGAGSFPAFAASTTTAVGNISFSEMRATPTLSNSTASDFRFNNATDNYVASAVSYENATTKSIEIRITSVSMTGNTGGTVGNVSSGYIYAESEL